MNNRRGFDWKSLNLRARRLDRAIFKAAALIPLFGFSIGPVFRHDYPARVLAVVAVTVLTALAARGLFGNRS
jgi:hypothetical protein